MLQRLVDQGNTVLVIEHNLDVIKTADWIIDLGPNGGNGGGQIVGEGTPEDIAKIPRVVHRPVPRPPPRLTLVAPTNTPAHGGEHRRTSRTLSSADDDPSAPRDSLAM